MCSESIAWFHYLHCLKHFEATADSGNFNFDDALFARAQRFSELLPNQRLSPGPNGTTCDNDVGEHHFVDTDTAFFHKSLSVFVSQVLHSLQKLLVTSCFLLQSHLCWKNFAQGSLSLEFGAKPQARSAEQMRNVSKAFLWRGKVVKFKRP